jgi:hypothetical protein
VLVVIGGWRLMVIAGCGGWSQRWRRLRRSAAIEAAAQLDRFVLLSRIAVLPALAF